MNYIELRGLGGIYKLMGIITSSEGNNINSHSFYKDPISNNWYKYNGSNVNEVINIKSEVLDNSLSNILIYQNGN